MGYDSPWIVQGPHEVRRPDEAPPRLRLVCIPPAGFGACYFSGWGAKLPRDIEVLPVELPGRNTRSREAKPQVRRAAPDRSRSPMRVPAPRSRGRGGAQSALRRIYTH